MNIETPFEEMLAGYLPSQTAANMMLNDIEKEININNPALSLYELHKPDWSKKDRFISRKKCEQCTGEDGRVKQGYFTEGEAQETVNIINENEGKFLRVYRCKHGGWHLTKAF